MRYLFGPVTKHFADQNLHAQRARGECVAFGYEAGLEIRLDYGLDWEALPGRLLATAGSQSGEIQSAAPKIDFVALYLPYTRIPAWLWRAPVPIVGLAADWNLLLFGNALPRNSVSPVSDLLMRGSAALSGAGDPSLAHDVREHLARSAGCAALHNLLGLLEGSGGEAARRADAPGRAIAHFRRALALSPGDILVRLNLAEALAIAGQVVPLD